MLHDIVQKPVEMKAYFSPEAKSLLSGLLTQNPVNRLGSGEADSAQIKSHPFFASIDWEKLYNK